MNTERYCEIEIKGFVEEHWSDWLGGLQIRHSEQGNSQKSRSLAPSFLILSGRDINSEF